MSIVNTMKRTCFQFDTELIDKLNKAASNLDIANASDIVRGATREWLIAHKTKPEKLKAIKSEVEFRNDIRFKRKDIRNRQKVAEANRLKRVKKKGV